MAVPVALAGPRPRFDDSHIHTELSQPRIPRQPLAGLPPARLVEGTWIGTARLRGHDRRVDLLHSVEHLKNEMCSSRNSSARHRLADCSSLDPWMTLNVSSGP